MRYNWRNNISNKSVIGKCCMVARKAYTVYCVSLILYPGHYTAILTLQYLHCNAPAGRYRDMVHQLSFDLVSHIPSLLVVDISLLLFHIFHLLHIIIL